MKKSNQIILSVLICVLAGFGIYYAVKNPKIADENQTAENAAGAENVGNADVSGANPTSSVFPPEGYEVMDITIGGKVLSAAVADSEEKYEAGLSGFDSIPENTGMIFVMADPGIYDFWMKDMKFNIDIFWMDENAVITHIEKNVSPETYPKTFSSPNESLYIVETAGGFADKYQIEIGDQMNFSGN
jgi:uncharacterized membrane protein (UPF0127 family)